MNPKPLLLATLLPLIATACSLAAQENANQPHPRAAKALERVGLQKNFGEFQFQKREIITLKENDRVKGLNGLMFAYYKKQPNGPRITLSIQWFEKEEDLLKFYNGNMLKQQGWEKKKVADCVVLSMKGMAYQWTDGEHFTVSMGGAPIPPELAKAYLALVPSRVGELAKKQGEKAGRERQERRPGEKGKREGTREGVALPVNPEIPIRLPEFVQRKTWALLGEPDSWTRPRPRRPSDSNSNS